MARSASTGSDPVADSAVQPDADADLASAAATREADEKAYAAATADHKAVIFVSPDGVEREALTPAEKVELRFAGWSEKSSSKKGAA